MSSASVPSFYRAACFIIPEGRIPPGLHNRPLYLPRPFIVDYHVQCKPKGTIYVYKEDIGNAARMRAIRKYTKMLQIPKGSPDKLRENKGEPFTMPRLFFHMAVLYRPTFI